MLVCPKSKPSRRPYFLISIVAGCPVLHLLHGTLQPCGTNQPDHFPYAL